MDGRPRVDPNKPITVNPFRPVLPVNPEEYNHRNERIEQVANLSVTGNLVMSSAGGNNTIAKLDRRIFWAILDGTANPYKFKEARINPDGTWTPLVGGLVSGTSYSAYELNNELNLAGSVQLLRPAAHTKFTFQSFKYGPDHHTPPCVFTVKLTNRDGNVPISGGSVSITSPDGSTCTGTTDSLGIYTCTFSVIPASPIVVTVSYGSCSYTGPIFCNETIDLCYCEANVHLTSNAGTPVLSGAFGGSWPGTDDGAGNYTYCKLAPCSSHFDLPGFFIAHAEADGYVSACQYVPVNCGDDITVDLILAEIPDCYLSPDWEYTPPGSTTPIASTCCPVYCHPERPQNPSTLADSGYIPSKFRVKFTSIGYFAPPGHFNFVSWFGDNEGSWIDLDLVSDSIIFTGFGGHTPTRLLAYEKCMGGSGNTYGNWSGFVNQLVAEAPLGPAPPGSEFAVPFGSNKAGLYIYCPYQSSGYIQVTYNWYKYGGCFPQPSTDHSPYHDRGVGWTLPGVNSCSFTPCMTFGDSPGNFSGTGPNGVGGWYSAESDGCCDYMMMGMTPDARMAYGPKFDEHALIVKGYGDSSTGYGRMTAQMMKALEQQDIPTAFQPIRINEAQRKLDPFLKDRIMPGNEK